MEDHSLSLPLLAAPAAVSSSASAAEDDGNGSFSSSSRIIPRFLLVIFIGTVSIWANHEASKGFNVTIINNAKESPAGQRFALFYVSNDEATRIILNTSAVVENILYPDPNQTKKPVHHVILQLASKNLTSKVIVDTSKSKEFVYTISLSPSILEGSNVKHDVIFAIQRAMARIWLWDGESRAPPWLIDGMEEYIWMQAGFDGHEKETLHPGLELFGPEQFCFLLSQVCSNSNNLSSGSGDGKGKSGRLCWEDKDPKIVAQAFSYLEQQKKGYIRGLNQMLRDPWTDNQPCER
ncbi:Plant basic secretory protein family protein, putative [Theobroma cacao]|uniref:Plant basic secretory protein family protein, putative n=1 Tax=Theobroma cacao TaxID=3641 RepID=A0A061DSQ8_THECC|nr:Plant basic secretory protein family protein, putative [Theobroma cacao]